MGFILMAMHSKEVDEVVQGRATKLSHDDYYIPVFVHETVSGVGHTLWAAVRDELDCGL